MEKISLQKAHQLAHWAGQVGDYFDLTVLDGQVHLYTSAGDFCTAGDIETAASLLRTLDQALRATRPG